MSKGFNMWKKGNFKFVTVQVPMPVYEKMQERVANTGVSVPNQIRIALQKDVGLADIYAVLNKETQVIATEGTV